MGFDNLLSNLPIVVTSVTVKRILWPILQFCWSESPSTRLMPSFLDWITRSIKLSRSEAEIENSIFTTDVNKCLK